MTGRLPRLAAAATPLAAAVVFSHGICGALFSCGCVPFTMAQCTIHHPIAGVPPCPWCTAPPLFLLAIGIWTSGAALAGFAAWRRPPLVVLAASAALVAVQILLSGALTVVWTGYPTLLGF